MNSGDMVLQEALLVVQNFITTDDTNGIVLQLYTSGTLLILLFTLASGSTQETSPTFETRQQAAVILSLLCNNEAHGDTVTRTMGEMLPGPLLHQLKNISGSDNLTDLFVSDFDQDHKTPELIWNNRCRWYSILFI